MREFEIQIGGIDAVGSSKGADSGAALAAQLGSLRPTCVPCSRDWRAKHTDALPGSVPVESALVMRDEPGRGYLAVVHCHGKSAVVELGHDTPSDNKIRSARAFA